MKKRPTPSIASRSRLSGIAAGFLVLVIFPVVIAAQQTGVYPGALRITKGQHLSAEGRQVEARFAADLEAHLEAAIARYSAHYGKEINADNVRELSPDYAPGGMDAVDPVTNAARTSWGEAVFQPARALSRELYRRALKRETPSHQRRQVFFTAGGAGVGKTTSIRQLPGLAHAVEAAEIVYDTTLSDLRSATERIDQALDTGRMVSIVFIYRDPVESLLGGVFPRAKNIGRIPTLEGFLTTHLGAVEVLPKIAEIYRRNSNVAIAVIDNSRGTAHAAVADVRFVEKMAHKYSHRQLKVKLVQALENAYEKGKKDPASGISEILYKAVNGSAP